MRETNVVARKRKISSRIVISSCGSGDGSCPSWWFRSFSHFLLLLSILHFVYRVHISSRRGFRRGRRIIPPNSSEDNNEHSSDSRRQQQQHADNDHNATTTRQQKKRILYIVTSIAEYDTGRRNTKKNYDRYQYGLVPIVAESIQSMLDVGNFHVDLFLITHYELTQERHIKLLREKLLPTNIQLQYWDDATPIGYDSDQKKKSNNNGQRIVNITRGLSRQHRYVIKDKLGEYDFFACFEDDMLLRGQQIQHYLQIQNTLNGLYEQSKRRSRSSHTRNKKQDSYYGDVLSTKQIQMLIPGYIRVEAKLPGFVPPKENKYPQIPVDFIYEYDNNSNNQSNNQTLTKNNTRRSIDPSICCHVPTHMSHDRLPASPDKNNLYFWETSIDALGLRLLPGDKLGWVVLLGGSNNEYVLNDYWTGRASDNNGTSYFSNQQRPDRKKGRYCNNQGGWMATREQVIYWHNDRCRGGFLPPYYAPHFKDDGLVAHSVEFWSGGIQMWGLYCNLQRIVLLDPQSFSKQLLYHTSNNKQFATNVRHRYSGLSINEFWGQLNTIRKQAEAEMKNQLQLLQEQK